MSEQKSSSSSTPLIGRELDALVAEKVMGKRRSMQWLPGYPRYVMEDALTLSEPCPAYSTDIGAAWELVERCGLSVIHSEDGWYALKPEDIVWGCVRGTDFPKVSLVGAEGEHDPFSIAYDSAPEAICIAALRAAVSGASQKGDRP